MLSRAAVAVAAAPSRDAMARTSQPAARCIPGIAFPVAMLAVDRTPQRTVRTTGLTLRVFVTGSGPPPHLTTARAWQSLAHVCKKGTQTLRVGRVVVGQRSETVRRANLSAIVR